MIHHLFGYADAHGVNPWLFIGIYAVSTVPFLLISGWLVHNVRRDRPLSLLVCLWSLCYAAPYIYVLVVGRGLDLWVYLAVAAVIVIGLLLALRGLRRRLAADAAD